MCAKGICGPVSIDTLNRYPWTTSWSILDQHLDRYLVDTRSTLNQGSVNSQLSVDWIHVVSIELKSVDSRQSVDRDVNGVLIGLIPWWTSFPSRRVKTVCHSMLQMSANLLGHLAPTQRLTTKMRNNIRVWPTTTETIKKAPTNPWQRIQ